MFFKNIINWIKSHKLATALIAVILFLLLPRLGRIVPLGYNGGGSMLGITGGGVYNEMAMDSLGAAPLSMKSSSRTATFPSPSQAAPRPDITDRKVITNSNISLQVKDVKEAIDKIKGHVNSLSGYVVSTSVNTQEFGESGYMAVRVPSATLDSTLEYFRSLSIKVVSENVSGNDITDQYVDIQERLDRLNATKIRFEGFMDDANTIEEILNVQRAILDLQNQIDSYVGQQKYMDGASETTLISINLSTDELGLPYLPEKAWRPQIVLKQAYRSLLLTLIKLGNVGIWLAVYAPLVVAAVIVFKLIKKLLKRNRNKA